jgi:aryl-alcohol dehydrogenase-like predicted oxidoreductase
MLLREALRGRAREQVVISDKFGGLRDPDGGWSGNDGRPASVNSGVCQVS